MQYYKILNQKIENKTLKIALVGLGYVGLPLAIEFAKKGYVVYGFDTSKSRIDKLNNGENYIIDVDFKEVVSLIDKKKFFPSTDDTVLNNADVIIVCVPTPLRKVKLPDISYVVAASKTIQKHLRKGQLIILESTSFPGTTREVMLPILQKTGLKEEKDFFVCFSPERVNPADSQFPVVKIPKAVGGLSKKSTNLAVRLYSRIIVKVFPVSTPEVAETAKLLENTFRMVNIALVNEFAMICHKMGIDIWEVIKTSKTKPFGFIPFYPGPGIGGHCIPCDPIYLSWKAKKFGFKTKMIDLAAQVNRYMPHYVIERIEEKIGRLKGKKILVLGLAYKKDVKDLRESPALDILENLAEKGVIAAYHDPLFDYLKIGRLDMVNTDINKISLEKFDCVVLVTDHSCVNYQIIQQNAKLIFDTRNVYKKTYFNVVKL